MSHLNSVRRRLVAPVVLAVAAMLASCKEPVAPVTAASTGEVVQAVQAAAGIRRVVAPVPYAIEAATVETRYWNSGPWYVEPVCKANGSCSSVWTRQFAGRNSPVAYFENLSRGVAGYTNAPVALTQLTCASVERAVPPVDNPTAPPDSADSYSSCVSNPGGANINLATRYRLLVSGGTAGVTLSVRFGVDFMGGALLVGGRVVAENWNDPAWWGYFETDIAPCHDLGLATEWCEAPVWVTDAASTLSTTVTVAAGASEVVEVIGFENGADYGFGVQFAGPDGRWMDVVSNEVKRTLTLQLGSSVGGRVTTDAGVDCTSSCTIPYAWGLRPVLTAVPDKYFGLSGWSGACSGTGSTCEPLMDNSLSVGASFVRRQWPVTVSVNNAAGGKVTSGVAGIDCGATCEAGFAIGSSVTLTAVPSTGYQVAGWTGCSSSNGNTCTVASLSSATAVGVTFARQTFQLAVAKAGNGTGQVTSVPANIDCGAACAATFEYGTSVTLAATPAATSSFAGWTGACANVTGDCTVAMTQARTVTATFTRLSAGDTEPPVASCKADPAVLWPVNHKQVRINVAVSLNEPGTFTLVGVSSNQADDAQGDGKTFDDVDLISGWKLGTADTDGFLRAERLGNGKDRIYTLSYRATDDAGNIAETSCTVTVPHDQRGAK